MTSDYYMLARRYFTSTRLIFTRQLRFPRERAGLITCLVSITGANHALFLSRSAGLTTFA